MKRVMVNLDDRTGEILEKKAENEKRSASSYVALLIEADLRASGLMHPSAHAELLAAAGEIGLPKALSVLKRAARRRDPDNAT